MDQEGGPTVLDLEEGSEWRFELEDDENIAVRVSAVLILNRSGDPERKAFRDGVRVLQLSLGPSLPSLLVWSTFRFVISNI
jgi:hypothetical protein